MKYIIGILAWMMLQGCNPSPSDSAAAEGEGTGNLKLTEAQEKQAGIVTGFAERKEIKTQLTLNGFIDVPPQNMISISFPLGGYLKYTQLLPGMKIRKGEVIAVMEDMALVQLQQNYLEMKSKFEWLKADFDRQKELNQSKAGSDKVFQQSKNAYEEARIGIKALAEKLKLIGIAPEQLSEDNLSRSVNITSPINGYVSSVKVNVGRYVSPTEVLFELVNPEDIHLNLIAFEQDLPKLSIGQTVMAFANESDHRTYPAEIILISKNLDKDRSAEVHCHFETFDHANLLPGMYMNANVTGNAQLLPAVPESALVNWEGKSFVVESLPNHQYRLLPVDCTEPQNGMIGIHTPGIEQKKLVLQNAYTVLMAMKNAGEE